MNVTEEISLKLPSFEEKKDILIVRLDIYKKILDEAKETTIFEKIDYKNVRCYNSMPIEMASNLKESYKFMTRQEYEEWRLQEIAKKRIGV